VSTFLYGRMMSRSTAVAPPPEAPVKALHLELPAVHPAGDNKLVAALAALVPAEILAAHAIIVAVTTATDAAGTTTITHPDVLKVCFILLLGLTAVLYLIGRGIPQHWTPIEVLRLLLPCVSFVVWTGLLGTSALSPWIPAGVSHAAVVASAALMAVLIVALSSKVQPNT